MPKNKYFEVPGSCYDCGKSVMVMQSSGVLWRSQVMVRLTLIAV